LSYRILPTIDSNGASIKNEDFNSSGVCYAELKNMQEKDRTMLNDVACGLHAVSACEKAYSRGSASILA
jgi:hypothetical protein